ncbi:hypothetical protein ACP70R_036018 [Stipagrostis hirtigluma subsp. patula]
MEASLLVAPKLHVSRTVPARGPSRRCLGAAAALSGHDDTDLHTSSSERGTHGVVPMSKVPLGARGGLFAAGSACLLTASPCHASAAALEAEASRELDGLYRAAAVLGDLDPATAKAVAGVAGPALSALGFLFILRIVMSWYPRLPVTKFPYVLAYAPTEPFLAVTRKVIPPLGGVDVTPVVWFGLVSFLNEILVGPQGLLVLLSQQV